MSDNTRSAIRFLQRLLCDRDFVDQVASLSLSPSLQRPDWPALLSSEGYTFTLEELRRVAGAVGGDTLEPEIWLAALVHEVKESSSAGGPEAT